MRRNTSSTDRVIRLVGAAALVALALVLGVGSVPGVALLVLAAVLVATAAAGFCPLYRLLGISTAPAVREPR